jgi:diguanylate cyclase (GGDEF)-like protein
MTSLDRLVSPAAVTFQAVGILLLALMMAQLGRIFGWRYARFWAFGWASLFVGLVAVRLSIAFEARWWWLIYVYAEWFYLGMLITGCREMVDHQDAIRSRRLLFLLPPAIAFGIVLVYVSSTFNNLFIVQSSIVSAGSFAAFLTLGRFGPARRSAGWQLMRAALALLTILFLAYVPLFWIHASGLLLPLLSYSSLADLLGAMLLGFGMVLVTSEEARRELNDTVIALQMMRDQLEEKIRTDPLTEALNRHAFRSMMGGGEKGQAAGGTVIMIDIDHLKQINDEAGHAAGDAAIRATANAIREKIRADDLLFRWGGDEFLLVMPNLRLETVNARLEPLAAGIDISQAGKRQVRLSWGGAEFGVERNLEQAIALADAEMYGRRLAARRAAG